MESRLIPVNAFIALASPRATSWPNTLYDVGYQLEGLEIPVDAGGARLVIDCVAFDAPSNQFLATEAKSGNNIEPEQARRYGSVDPKDLVRIIGVTIVSPGEQSVEIVYVCLDESVERVQLGLAEAGCVYPVLAVGSASVTLHGPHMASERLAAAFDEPVAVPGPPPAIIRLDDESADDEYDRVVSAALMAEVSRGTETVSCPDLAARAIRHLPLYGRGHRNTLVKAVTRAAQRLSEAAPETFEFRGSTQERDHGVVKILDNPEQADPRGRTQRYQSIAGRLGGPVPTEPGPQQGALFDEIDLAAELEKADTGDQEDDPEEER